MYMWSRVHGPWIMAWRLALRPCTASPRWRPAVAAWLILVLSTLQKRCRSAWWPSEISPTEEVQV